MSGTTTLPTGNGLDRRGFLRYTGLLGTAAAMTATLAACGGTTNATTGSSGKALGTAAHPAGTITGTLAFLLSSGFDPMNASSAVALCCNSHIFEGLTELDPVTREPYLGLAKAQPTASADGLTWTATLRDGAKFSDGTAVTAEDVAWSFTRVLDPANAAIVAPFVTSFLDSVTATDANTVSFKLSKPFPLFAQRISVIKIVPKAKTGDAAASKSFDGNPIGTGPFKVTSSSATTGVVMANNTLYNGTRPALVTGIVLNTSTDDNARLNDLDGGQSQAIEAVPYLNAGTVASPFKVDAQQAFNCLFLMFNCAAAPFDDKRVRQALFYAIDTTKVINGALSGYGSPATGYLDEANSGYQRAATVYSYDPGKAKSLLAEAGVSNLSFELVTTNTAFVSDSAPIIIESWKQIGVNATLNTSPSASVYGTLVPSSDFRVLAASGDPSIYGPDTDLMLRWFYYGKTWPVSRERWTDEAAAKAGSLIDQASTQSGAAQKATWKEVFDLVADEVPLYPVFHTKTVTGYDPSKMTDFHAAPSTGLYFLNVGRTA